MNSENLTEIHLVFITMIPEKLASVDEITLITLSSYSSHQEHSSDFASELYQNVPCLWEPNIKPPGLFSLTRHIFCPPRLTSLPPLHTIFKTMKPYVAAAQAWPTNPHS